MRSQKDCIAMKKSLSWSYHTPTKWNTNWVLTTNFRAFALNKLKAYVEFLWENIHWHLYVSCHEGAEMSFVNVRRVMLKHRRGAKCPLLVKFFLVWSKARATLCPRPRFSSPTKAWLECGQTMTVLAVKQSF